MVPLICTQLVSKVLSWVVLLVCADAESDSNELCLLHNKEPPPRSLHLELSDIHVA